MLRFLGQCSKWPFQCKLHNGVFLYFYFVVCVVAVVVACGGALVVLSNCVSQHGLL